MQITYHNDLTGIDWPTLKQTLAADQFDNGRSPEQLERSFRNSHVVCIARCDGRIVATARILSDGVCNAYLVDAWTHSEFRRQGIAREMIDRLCRMLAGQHVYLQADPDNIEFYRRVGFNEQPTGMSRVIGNWLENES